MSEDGSLFDDMIGAGVGMVPVIGPILEPFGARLFRKVRAEHARNASKALRAAQRLAGMSREDLGEAIADDPRLVSLAARLLFLAGMNGHDDTLAALGVALGDAVLHPQRVDEAELIMDALADLRPQHILILRTVLGREGEGVNPPVWRPYELPAATGLPESTTTLCLAQLMASGLTRTETMHSLNAFVPTDLARTLLEVLPFVSHRS